LKRQSRKHSPCDIKEYRLRGRLLRSRRRIFSKSEGFRQRNGSDAHRQSERASANQRMSWPPQADQAKKYGIRNQITDKSDDPHNRTSRWIHSGKVKSRGRQSQAKNVKAGRIGHKSTKSFIQCRSRDSAYQAGQGSGFHKFYVHE
jgi:hypothetical protein